jgi:hypothetical protein
MRRIRRHLTFANVASAIALFVALGGGTAGALGGHNTVFSDDIVNGQVKTADVADDTLSGGGLVAADLRANSVGSSETGSAEDEIKDGAVDAQDINGAIPPTVVIDPPAVPAQSCVTGQNAIAGVTNIDHLLVTTPATFTPNLSVTPLEGADSDVRIRVCNPTGGTIDPGAKTFHVIVIR